MSFDMNIASNALSIETMLIKSKINFEIPSTDHKIAVERFQAEEGISDLYEVNLWLICEEQIHFNEVIQEVALLSIDGKETRYFHGVINSFMLTGQGGRFYFYQASLVPAIWYLSLNKEHRIFQDMTTEEIVREVLGDYNILSDGYKFRLAKDYQKRRYCTQYGESDFHFISRLLEEEGIFYFFEHSEDRHLLVFADDTVAYLDISGEKTIHMHHDAGMVPEKEVIESFGYVRNIRPGKVTQTNYNFKKPSLKLQTEKMSKTHENIEVYEYPGSFGYPDEANRTAQVRLEEKKTIEEVAQGIGNCARFTPGYTFNMTSHDYKDLNKDYLLLSLEHRGSQLHVLGEYSGIGGDYTYSNEFTAIPASITLRPEKVHMKPVVYGPQSAVVVGPKGEEIFVDEFCRVKVQFAWDRKGCNDEKSSCWVRVLQAWGGGGWGAVFIPRIGDEVLIDFQNGDPDWPILVGSIYNGKNTPLYDLKNHKTCTVIKSRSYPKGGPDNFNELRFDDAKGQEEIYLQSEKDWNILVKNNKGQTIGGNSSTMITGAMQETAKEITLSAFDKITVVSGASSIEITPSGIQINSPRVDINNGGSAAMPKPKGCTGKGGKFGGGGASGSWDDGGSGTGGGPGPKSMSSTPSSEKRISKGSTFSANEEMPLGDFQGTVPSGGWAGEEPANGMPTPAEWRIGPVTDNVLGPGDFVSSGTSLPQLKATGILGAGDLKSKTSQAVSMLQNPSSIQDEAIHEGQSRLNQELSHAQVRLLEKAGAGEVRSKMTQLSEKSTNLLDGEAINSDVLVEKF